MANQVYANNREIACKKAAGKAICAFPDVCFTPPQTPATPPGVPIPYPNTGMAKDTTKGSRKTRISGAEIMLKDQSHFKTSYGDEAGCAPKKGLITSKNKGKIYFNAWSMDVKVEGKNAVRHLDLTTHNHASLAGQTGPWPYVDETAFGKIDKCADDRQAMKDACDNEQRCPGVLGSPVKQQRRQVAKAPSRRSAAFQKHASLITPGESPTSNAAAVATAEADGSACVQKSRCYLRPYEAAKKEDGCCPGQTPHHIPPKACLKRGSRYQRGYKPSKALCVCLEGANQHVGSHGKNHAAIEDLASKAGIKVGAPCNLAEYNKLCAAAVSAQCGCDEDCIEAQLNQSFKDPDKKTIKHTDTNSSGELDRSLKEKLTRAVKRLTGR